MTDRPPPSRPDRPGPSAATAPGAPVSREAPDRDTLMAYIDGQLDLARAKEVRAYLEHSPEAAEDVAAWRAQNEALRAIASPQEARLHAAAIAARLNGRPSGARGLQMAAAIGAALIVGGIGGWLGHDQVSGNARRDIALTVPLIDQAIAAHAVYAVDVLHPVEVGASEEAHLVGWLSNRLGAPMAAPDLRGAGFALVGGRLLSAIDGPAAQFMYENQTGDRITLYAEKAPTDQLAAFRFETKDGLNSFYWQDPVLRYALVGAIDHDSLKALATEVYRQIS